MSNPALSRDCSRFNKRIGEVALVLSMVFALAWPAFAREFDAYGGSGDRQNIDSCPVGQFLTGVTARSGAWIDQVAIICAPIAKDGSTGGLFRGPSRGGNGGGPPQHGTCAPGSVIIGVGLQMTSQKQVKAFRFNCASMQSASRADMIVGNAVLPRPNCRPSKGMHCPRADHYRQDCPADQAVTGLKINSGAHVNAIGLICGRKPQLLPQPKR